MTVTLPTARTIDPLSVPPLRWGAIGAGGIVRVFSRALHAHTPQRVVAVAARDPQRTEVFAREAGIDRAVTPQALVEDPSVDVVYIGTPHISHLEYALLAIAAGKHVLVEKPLAMTAEEGRILVAAARAAGVFAMEAMWTRYLPQADIIRQVLERGDLGAVRHVEADFGFRVPFIPSHRLWNPQLGGGALLDMGVYPLSFASSVIGPPQRLAAFGDVAVTGVDSRAAVQLQTQDGATAQVHTSITEQTTCRAVIEGGDGRLEVQPYFHAPSGLRMTLGGPSEEQSASWTDTALQDPHDAIAYQATALASYVSQGITESPLHGLDETVSVLASIDEARRQVLSTESH